MSLFYMDVKDMLADYGTDITVYDASKAIKPHYRGAVKIGGHDAPPEPRHEPVLPFSSTTAQLAVILNGGSEVQGDLLWLSTGNYPEGTTVDVPSQGGRYTVTSSANYQDYSNLRIYQLKGDDHHDD